MRPQTTIAVLASAIDALARCQEPPVREFGVNLHRATIDRIMADVPHGSGIDDKVTLDEVSNRSRVVFNVPFHRMNERGHYDGWLSFRVTIRPTFSGVDVDVTGRGDEGTKDWIADVFRDFATAIDKEPARPATIPGNGGKVD